LNAAVSQAFLDDLGIKAGGNQGCCMGASKIVEGDATQARLLDGWFEVALKV
jgi:hypothetical protein